MREHNPLPVSYQPFKRKFIATIPRQARQHTIDVNAINTWAHEQAATHHPLRRGGELLECRTLNRRLDLPNRSLRTRPRQPLGLAGSPDGQRVDAVVVTEGGRL